MKNGPKNQSYFLNPSWSQCGTILVQLLGHLVPTWPNLVPTWSQLGPNMAPKPPVVQGMRTHFSVQNAIKFFWNSGNSPKSLLDPPQELIFDNFWLIFDWFLVDLSSMLFVFWSNVDGFLVEFLFMFGSCVAVLLVFWFAGLLLCWFADSPNFHKGTHQLT